MRAGNEDEVGRKLLINDADLIGRLSQAFREHGFEGASLAILSRETGLKKASLYHRFPGGKEQMAQEVLESTRTWLEENVLAALRSDAAPKARIALMIRKLDGLYAGGRQACILNLLSATGVRDGPFAGLVRDIFTAWINGIAGALVEAGLEPAVARRRAERAVTAIQGALVLSHGLGDTGCFRDALRELPDELLGAG